MTSLRVGVIGGGWIAESIVPAVRAAGSAVIGLVDPDPARRRRWQPTCPTFASSGELLASAPDVVFVLTPTDTHADLAVAALTAGADVVVEKPLAAGAAACDRIVAAAAAAGRRVLVEESYLWTPSHIAALAAVAAGRIGTVRTIVFTFYGWRPRPERVAAVAAANAGGWRVATPFAWLHDHAVHLVALSKRLAGAATVERMAALGGPTEDLLRGATWRCGDVDVVWVRATEGVEGALGVPTGLHTRVLGSAGWVDVLGEGGRWGDGAAPDALRFSDGATLAVEGEADLLWEADTPYYPVAHRLGVAAALAHLSGLPVDVWDARDGRDDVVAVEALVDAARRLTR